MASMTDPEKNLVYDAESLVRGWLDAVDPETGTVTVTLHRGGKPYKNTYSPEPEVKFSKPPEVGRFVNKTLKRLRMQRAQFGTHYFDRELKDVKIVASRARTTAHYYRGQIFIPDREKGGAWALRSMVALHELTHHLNSGLDGILLDAHGEGFRHTFITLLEDIGWTEISRMLRDAYREVGLDREHPVQDTMLIKIGKILRHAEGASTEAERDTFLTKAQELAAGQSIELALARAAIEKNTERDMPTVESVILGHPGSVSNVRFVKLMLSIAFANDVHCTIKHDNSGVDLYGFQSDIDVTKALYVSLLPQMVADADAYIRSGVYRPVHGRTARVSFYAGWTARIGNRLYIAKSRTNKSATTDESLTEEQRETTALAIRAKEVEVRDYYNYELKQKGIRRAWSGGGSARDRGSIRRGSAAADNARIGGSKALG